MNAATSPRPVLHDYFRSSASYRVRIALNLKHSSIRGNGIHAPLKDSKKFSQMNKDGSLRNQLT